MTTPAIRVEGLGKRYRLAHGQERARYRTLRESLTGLVAAPFKKRSTVEEFWALNDVSFEVQPGEVVGIIGRNGAGKSTLLKVLSRITKPTTGRVEINGRVGSLLEVGTGFHPELTGRENIYLNGSILGMSRKEIDRKFDEIVAFAEVEKFLDTPVKRYSSGMYVRLAFAVAAHLEPEILIVDEVLAVGDAEFQKKCMGKMKDVSLRGRTVLFVSHNMTAVRSLCSRGILLSKGQIFMDGTANDVISRYFANSNSDRASTQDLHNHPGRPSGDPSVMKSVSIRNGDGLKCGSIGCGEQLEIEVVFETGGLPIRPVLGLVVRDQYGSCLFGNNNRTVPGYRFDSPVVSGTVSLSIPNLPLMPGNYLIDLFFGDDQQDIDGVFGAIEFRVHPADPFGSGKLPPSHAGPFLVGGVWSLRTAP